MRRTISILALTLGMGMVFAPTASRGEDCTVCSRVEFAKHMDWAQFDNWNDKKLRNPMAAGSIKARVKSYAAKAQDTWNGCDDNEFMRKTCKAAKACVIAGGSTLYTGVALGNNIWEAERAAVLACEAAILASWYA